MKILLLGHGRCGSTSLHLGLSDVMNLTKIIEPFNQPLWDNYYKSNPPYQEGDPIDDNTIFKCINGPNFNNEWIIENYQKFDKVIILIRSNIKETLISHCNALEYGYLNQYTDTNSITPDSISYVSENYNWLFNFYLNSESTHLIWYEDVYSNYDTSKRTLLDAGIELSNQQFNILWKKYLSPTHRLRKV